MKNNNHMCPICKDVIMQEIPSDKIDAIQKASGNTNFESGTHGTRGTDETIDQGYFCPRPSIEPAMSDTTASYQLHLASLASSKIIIGIPYEYPKCGFKQSYRS